MKLIEKYKGYRILKNTRTGFFKVGCIGADFSNIEFLKKIIDKKILQ